MHHNTDALDDLIGLYASPLDWARAALQLEHNADDYLEPDGSYDYHAFLLDVANACCVTFVEFDAGVAAIYHG
jgi:hypothetical protein